MKFKLTFRTHSHKHIHMLAQINTSRCGSPLSCCYFISFFSVHTRSIRNGVKLFGSLSSLYIIRIYI